MAFPKTILGNGKDARSVANHREYCTKRLMVQRQHLVAYLELMHCLRPDGVAWVRGPTRCVSRTGR